jgi:hypothetical protein
LTLARLAPILIALVAGTLSGYGCSRKPPDGAPEAVVRELLDDMERAEGDPSALHGALELLSEATQANLAERARRASAATGRTVPAEEMLAPARFALRFQPRQMHVHLVGDRALVDIVGIDPDSDRAQVTCVSEAGRWRVDITLPVLPATERRPDAGI